MLTVKNDPVNFIDPFGLERIVTDGSGMIFNKGIPVSGAGIDEFQILLDAIGVFDPTFLSDGLNAFIYVARCRLL